MRGEERKSGSERGEIEWGGRGEWRREGESRGEGRVGVREHSGRERRGAECGNERGEIEG